MARRSSKKQDQDGFSLQIALDGVPFLTLTDNTIAGLSLSDERKEAIKNALEALSTFIQCSDHGGSEPKENLPENLMAVPAWLSAQTYRVEYNPNCPSPFLVRLVAKGRSRIYGDEKDALGYGKTLDEAAEAAKNKARTYETAKSTSL